MTSDVVISGIAGKFPESENLEELWDHLMSGVDLLTWDDRRWNSAAYGIPLKMGRIKNIERFDAQCFGVSQTQANSLDPKIRTLIEVTQEALFDAGLNPSKLRGTHTGVYVGDGMEEGYAIWMRSRAKLNGYVGVCSSSGMSAMRISYTFDFQGPSFSISGACASSLVALENAYSAVKLGTCNQAIAAGTQILLEPRGNIEFHLLKLLTEDGRCRVFDASASGFVRSEAVVVVYLCKQELAKRSYATIVHARTNNAGYQEDGITHPSFLAQGKLFRSVYEECGVSPLDVGYIEAHGTGTELGDPVEISSIANVFCKGRKSPLLVGSCKSNIGHPEVCSGLCGIVKILLAHVHSILPPNLHFEVPNPRIPALLDGRIKVVTEPTPFNEQYAACNSFGFGGTNAHVLLKLTPKMHINSWEMNLPILVPISGRTFEAVHYIIKKLQLYGNNHHAVALIHEVFKTSVSRYMYRGYTLVATKGSEFYVNETASEYSLEPSVWFICSGFGSQWTGMGRNLLRLRKFREAILQSCDALSQKNVDLLEVLNSEDFKVLENIKNAMIAITAIQTALVDLLEYVGVTPTGIVGHSHGEVAAAYADGCYTKEQAVLVAFGKGIGFTESGIPEGTAAAVGLSWEEAKRRCPVDIYPVIHNSKNNVTVSGPREPVKDFLKILKDEGILAKEIKSAPYAFHSPYIKGVKSLMQSLLEKAIPIAKPRSSRWLSTSIPEKDWKSDLAKFASAAYQVHNVLSPVFFYEALLKIPAYAITLEIGPHCFMQTILKDALPHVTANIGLMSKFAEDNVHYFINALGKIHLNGYSVDVSKLYAPVAFPVGPETPVIGPWIKFDHSQIWDVPCVDNELSNEAGVAFIIDLKDELDSFYEGHVLHSKIIFPAAGYIVLAWKAFTKLARIGYEMCPVVIEQLQFVRLTVLYRDQPTKFIVTILSEKGDFEIKENSEVVAHGRVRRLNETNIEMVAFKNAKRQDINTPSLTKEDFYKAMRLKGYEWSGIFKGVQNISMQGDLAEIQWADNWITFLDTMFQTSILRNPHFDNRDIYALTRIKKVAIDPQMFQRNLDTTQENLVTVNTSTSLNIIHCVGIQVTEVQTGFAARRLENTIPTYTKQMFLPFLESKEEYSLNTFIEYCIGIVIDNTQGKQFSFTEYFTNPDSISVASLVSSHCLGLFDPPVCINVQLKNNNLSLGTLETEDNIKRKPCHLLYTDINATQFQGFVAPRGFILIHGMTSLDLNGFIKIAVKNTSKFSLTLYRQCYEPAQILAQVVVEPTGFEWVETLKTTINNDSGDRIILVSKSNNGLQGFMKCLLRENSGENVRAFSIDLGSTFKDGLLTFQLSYDLVLNVFSNSCWGCYANFIIPNEEQESLREQSLEAYAHVLVVGDLSSLSWIELPKHLTDCGNMICMVEYGALNFKDVMLATGKLSRDLFNGQSATNDCIIGNEYSGVWGTKRVMGVGPSRCLATRVEVDPFLTWEVPQSWTLAEAATIPIAYATAFYGLVILGQLCNGESVLIHGGAGGVGQAAITVALHMGCTVYTTVGSEEKREYLKNRFPQLQDEYITDSRNAINFKTHVKEHTNGRGVDVVLNSLAHDKFHASVDCLAEYGRFIEIGKLDLYEDTKLGMSLLLKSVSLTSFALDDMLAASSVKRKQKLVTLLQEGIDSEIIKPLPFTTFKHDKLEDAFRYMATGKHIGKVIIHLEKENIVSLPRSYFYHNKSYILIGGLGGMGLEIVGWMIQRGARNFIISSRSGVTSPYQQYRMKGFESRGANISIVTNDVSTHEGVGLILDIADQIGPLGGIFNMALALQDGLFDNQSSSKFESVSKAKAIATLNFDQATRERLYKLDHFVVFSSIVSARGNAGQTNYGFANSYMERICEKRRRDGLAGLAIQWGVIGDVGYVFENMNFADNGKILGLQPQPLSSWLSAFDMLLRRDHGATVSSFVSASTKPISVSKTKTTVEKVAHILGIQSITNQNLNSNLFELGMDSIMANEITNVLSFKKREGSKLSGILGNLTLAQIKNVGNDFKSEVTPVQQETLLPFSKQTIRKLVTLEQSRDIVFIVHAIDGNLSSLELLASQLEATVYAIEGIKEAPLESLEVLARFYVQEMKRIQPKGPYNLCGYSLGGGIAFEMALQIEKRDEEVSSLLLLDTSPIWKHVFQGMVQQWKLNDFPDGILCHFVASYTGARHEDITQELQSRLTLDEKVAFVAKRIKPLYVDLDVEEIKELATAYSHRTLIADNYTPNGRVKCRAVLIKCLQGFVEKFSSDDYGLSEVRIVDLKFKIT